MTKHGNERRKRTRTSSSPNKKKNKNTYGPTSPKRKKKRSRKAKKHSFYLVIWNSVFYLLMGLLLIGSGLMAVMQQQDKSLNGYRMFGVLTNSMVSPGDTVKPGGFRAGDILIVQEVPAEKVKVGDVITYKPSTNPTNKSTNNLTHRVVKINDHLGEEKGIFFVTKGDANQTDDMPISASALVGKEVFVVPKVGGLLAFIKENWLISLVFIVSIVGFIWVMRAYIMSEPKQAPRKKGKKKQQSRPNKRDISSKEVNINRKTHNRRKQR